MKTRVQNWISSRLNQFGLLFFGRERVQYLSRVLVKIWIRMKKQISNTLHCVWTKFISDNSSWELSFIESYQQYSLSVKKFSLFCNRLMSLRSLLKNPTIWLYWWVPSILQHLLSIKKVTNILLILVVISIDFSFSPSTTYDTMNCIELLYTTLSFFLFLCIWITPFISKFAMTNLETELH